MQQQELFELHTIFCFWSWKYIKCEKYTERYFPSLRQVSSLLMTGRMTPLAVTLTSSTTANTI
jgi:hypothetical protein